MNLVNKANGFQIFSELTRRHLLVFFRNKVRLLYTLLVPVIIFLVYVLFLRSLELSTVQNIVLTEGLDLDAQTMKYVEALVDSWMLSGIAALSTITVALQTNNVFVEDKQNGVNRDFASSPIPRVALIGSYFLFNFIVTVLVCTVYLGICLVYLACMGEFFLGFINILEIVGILLYTSLAATLMTVFICSFIKTEGTMASLVAVFSTAVGFLIGAYMPLGLMADWLQGICGFIPGTYACSLFRYSFMGAPLAQLQALEGTVLTPGFIEELTKSFGYDLNFFGITVEPAFQAVANGAFILIFLGLNLLCGSRLSRVLGTGKNKKKKAKN